MPMDWQNPGGCAWQFGVCDKGSELGCPGSLARVAADCGYDWDDLCLVLMLVLFAGVNYVALP
ncbi:MAG: hypothetical protein SNJ85_03930 [Cyanobacteriota bacterium]